MTRVSLVLAVLSLALPASSSAAATVTKDGTDLVFTDDTGSSTGVDLINPGGTMDRFTTVPGGASPNISVDPGIVASCTGDGTQIVTCDAAALGTTGDRLEMLDGDDEVCSDGSTCDYRVTVNAGSGNDTVFGSPHSGDVLNLGPGVDSAQAQSGDDTVNARDGENDAVNCGTADGPSGDTANVDDLPLDDTQNCEIVNRPTPPASPIADALVAGPIAGSNPFRLFAQPSASKKMPDFEPKKRKFKNLRQARETLDGLDVPYDLKLVKIPTGKTGADDEDILKQRPAPGATIAGTLANRAAITLTYFKFNPKQPRRRTCVPFVELAGDDIPMTDYLRNKYLNAQEGRDGAVEALKRNRCKYTVFYRDDRKASSTYVEKATRRKSKKTGDFFFELDVVRPKQPDFFLVTRHANVTGQDLTFATDFKLTEAPFRNFTAMTVQVGEIASGRLVPNAQVELYDVDGQPVSFRGTEANGEATFRFRTEKAGKFEIVARDIKDDGTVMLGWRSEEIVDRKLKNFTTLRGTEWRFNSKEKPPLYESVPKPAPPLPAMVPATLAAGGDASSSPKPPVIQNALGIRGQQGGQLIAGPVQVATVPAAGSVLVTSAPGLLALGGNGLISNKGGGILADNGSGLTVRPVPLISDKGAGLISDKGAGLIGNKGGGALPTGPFGAVGQNGNGIVSQQGGGLAGGNSYVPAGIGG